MPGIDTTELIADKSPRMTATMSVFFYLIFILTVLATFFRSFILALERNKTQEI
jgi:hypothetical protein